MNRFNKRISSMATAALLAAVAFFGAENLSATTIGSASQAPLIAKGGGHHGGHHGHHHHGGHHGHHGHHHHGGHHGQHDQHGDYHGGNHADHQGERHGDQHDFHHGYWHGGGTEWNGHPGYYYDPNYYYSGTTKPAVEYVAPATTIKYVTPQTPPPSVPVTPQ